MADQNEGLSTHRLEALTDGIFAFAMTLLVLNFNVPKAIKGIGSKELSDIILSQSDRFQNYFMSFALLAIFWLVNQQIFHHIKKTDGKHIWMNILTLMFVVFIPFSTSLISEYPDRISGEFFFALNIFLISASIQLGWIYANWERRLVKDESEDEHLRKSLRAGWVGPAVSAFAMAFAFIQPRICSYLYLLIPAVLLLPWFRRS
jgi:uncharacterized membrane protein